MKKIVTYMEKKSKEVMEPVVEGGMDGMWLPQGSLQQGEGS